jgi:hypothetical protein
MPTTSEGTAKRFTARLKTRQVALLDESGRRPSDKSRAHGDGALVIASVYAARKLLDALYADVAPPADATRVSAWDDVDGQVSRYFRGTKRGAKVRVDIAGSQNADGTVAERVILIDACDAEVDAAAARQIAADLLAAADELDRLARAGDDSSLRPDRTN